MAVGLNVVKIGDGIGATSVGSLSRVLPAGGKFSVTSQRPCPAIPARGSARENIHKEPGSALHKEQESYLVEAILEPV